MTSLLSVRRLQFNRLLYSFRLNVVETKAVETSAINRAAGARSHGLLSRPFEAFVSGSAAPRPGHGARFSTQVNPVFPKPSTQGSNGLGESKRGDLNTFHPCSAAISRPDSLIEVFCHAD